MIHKQMQLFWTAVMFYTRIPCPTNLEYSEAYLNKATRFFPLIGWIVAAISISVLYAAQWVLPISVSVILALAASVLTTGAFHEDGFADVCDGFGGGWTTDKILTIMKDSRVGAYALIGVILLFGLKISALIELATFNIGYCIKSIILAHVLSRFIPVTIMRTHEYARMDATSKVKPIAKKLAMTDFYVAAFWTIPALLLFQSIWIVLVFAPLLVAKWYLARYFQKWIGGYTGDCLGAVQQICFVITLLFCLGLCKYI